MDDCGISKLDLKKRNRIQILRVIRDYGPISRIEIAEILKLTRAAVTMLVNQMISQQILTEIGVSGAEEKNPRKGRRKILLDINETHCFAVGVYIDETEIQIGLTTLSSAVLDKKSISHHNCTEPQTLAELIEAQIHTFLQNNCLSPEQLVGIGIGVMPSMHIALQEQTDESGHMTFPLLETYLERQCKLPVYTENAVLEFAMLEADYPRKHIRPVNHLLLHKNGNDFTLYPMFSREPLLKHGNASIHMKNLHIFQNSADSTFENIGIMFSADLLKKTVDPIFSPEQTPRLHQILDGDLSNITLHTLLTAAEDDLTLQRPTEMILTHFCVQLYNLLCLYNAEELCLMGFGLTENNLKLIRRYAGAVGGASFSRSIRSCAIRKSHRFVCGASYAIQQGFFLQGGEPSGKPN